MEIIQSDVKDRVEFHHSLMRIMTNLNELQTFNDSEKKEIIEKKYIHSLIKPIQSLIETIEELESFSLIHSKLAYILYQKINCEGLLSFIIRSHNLKFTIEDFKKQIEEYYILFLKATLKHKVSPVEYYKFVVEKKFDKNAFFYYSNNFILRILNSGEVIIFPLDELLEIHLKKGLYEKMGSINLTDKCNYEIHFTRDYMRWGGVGKDDYNQSDYYSFSSDLQLVELTFRNPS